MRIQRSWHSYKYYFLLMNFVGFSFVAEPAKAVILAEEDFSHPNGNLVGQAPNPGPGLAWAAHTDEGNTPIQVVNGMASLSQGKGSGGREDANTEFTHQSLDATTYARFDFMLPSAANSDIINLDEEGSNFAHLKSSRLTNHFRARTGVLAPAGDGDFRLAINANGSRLNEGTAWGTGLYFDTFYRVVINWNAVTGESMLWLNPVDELSPSISSMGHSTMQIIESFTLRQSSDYYGTQLVDNLVVASTFAEALLGSRGEMSSDFDRDGDVDGHDFLVWQGDPSIGDLDVWQANYATNVPLSAASKAVPEPSIWVLLSLAAVVNYLTSRRRTTL
ncbi:hypothetical protein [Bythopirellula polymerisocia]|uniref:PEP-CTERM protein-sorting domain-containing protein n=1 Tax=Bythopirellula polymerisocia TaxID=2528003 RepID=A0A5C6C8G6_9BACT|nr:hypothetical protein [Bythopirellula polymerisocia]TWU20337.1 hypothetical protein Pla144_49840 [Bythopirellula polymerisocia]